MKRFLLIFTGAATPFGKLTPEEAESIKSQWNQWAQSIGESLLDEGGPLGNGLEAVKNQEEPGRALPIHGYAVIQAQDVNRAVTLAQSHPFLQYNEPAGDFGINVLEISPEPGSYQPHPTDPVEYTDYIDNAPQPDGPPAAGQQPTPPGGYAPPAVPQQQPQPEDNYAQDDYQVGSDGELEIQHEEQPASNAGYQNQPGQVVGPGQGQGGYENQPQNPAPPQGPYQPQPNPGPLPPSQQGPPPPLPPQQRRGNPTLNKPDEPLVM